MTTNPDPKPVLLEGELYLGDNGRCFCIRHAGATALYTGRDLSGQRVHRLTADEIIAATHGGWTPQCEGCAGEQRRAARDRQPVRIKAPRTRADLEKDPRVLDVEDDRADRNGWWATLAHGWRSPDMECHTIHEPTLREVCALVARAERCDCARCTDRA